METSENERRVSLENKTADQVNRQAGFPGDRRYRFPSMDMVPTSSSTVSGTTNPISSTLCSSVPVVNTGNPSLRINSTGSPNFGFAASAIPGTSIAPNCIPGGKPFAMPSRGMFLAPPMPEIIPANLSHFPTDSAFIERAARFSCFGGGGFSSMVSPFGLSGPMPSYANVTKDMLGAQLQRTDSKKTEAKDHFQSTDHGSKSDSPVKNLNNEGTTHVGSSNNDPRKANLAESSQEPIPHAGDPVGGSSSVELNSKKRKRNNQDTESDQVHGATRPSIEKTENKQKMNQNDSKTNGKQVEDISDGGKEGYIHIRARRGQATNSHSLAERVRREKISERMKYLQDLVPGCSKVTGKAVMLDEIINYVQSLQRQVEFLSMKLAAVNPRLDFNINGILAGDVFHSRAGPSSAVGFSPDMVHPQLYLSQHGLAQPGTSGMASHSDALKRMMNAQLNTVGSYKEPALQMHGTWDEELQHAMQSSYGANPPVNSQEFNSKVRDRFQAYDHQW